MCKIHSKQQCKVKCCGCHRRRHHLTVTSSFVARTDLFHSSSLFFDEFFHIMDFFLFFMAQFMKHINNKMRPIVKMLYRNRFNVNRLMWVRANEANLDSTQHSTLMERANENRKTRTTTLCVWEKTKRCRFHLI